MIDSALARAISNFSVGTHRIIDVNKYVSFILLMRTITVEVQSVA